MQNPAAETAVTDVAFGRLDISRPRHFVTGLPQANSFPSGISWSSRSYLLRFKIKSLLLWMNARVLLKLFHQCVESRVFHHAPTSLNCTVSASTLALCSVRFALKIGTHSCWSTSAGHHRCCVTFAVFDTSQSLSFVDSLVVEVVFCTSFSAYQSPLPATAQFPGCRFPESHITRPTGISAAAFDDLHLRKVGAFLDKANRPCAAMC
jgi:hypothetical protein